MITLYRYTLTGSTPLRPSDSYRLYGWLLEQVPEDFGDLLHRQQLTPISQHLSCSRDGDAIWTVALLGNAAREILTPCLESLGEIPLHGNPCRAALPETRQVCSVQDLIAAGAAMGMYRRITMEFCSPTSFKQNGRYVLFPQERLILQSLVAKWDELMPDYPLNDPDAMQMLEAGIAISDYRLRSARYALKGTRIPGFMGQLTLDVNLSPPMQQIWNALCVLAPFTGVGIKTALGMGGVRILRDEHSD